MLNHDNVSGSKVLKLIIYTISVFFLLNLFSYADENKIMSEYYSGQLSFTEGDYENAYKTWLPLAEQGFVKAQSDLAYLYSKGLGVERDISKSNFWLESAAKSDDLQAKYNLAAHYTRGSGVEENIIKAESILRTR